MRAIGWRLASSPHVGIRIHCGAAESAELEKGSAVTNSMRRTDVASAMNNLTERVIGAAIEVHRHLGPGLLESVYEVCLCQQLALDGIRFERQLAIPFAYKGVQLDAGYRLDVVVEQQIVLELKSVEQLLPIHDAQVITYLKLTGLPLGLLINFNVAALARGVKRFANTSTRSSAPSAAPQ